VREAPKRCNRPGRDCFEHRRAIDFNVTKTDSQKAVDQVSTRL